MNQRTGHPGRCRGDRGRRADLPPDRHGDRERDRRRLSRRRVTGAVVQRTGVLPPHQPGHRREGAQPARRRRCALQETRSRDVRRRRRPRTVAQAPSQRVRRPVHPPADDRGPQARHLGPRARGHDRRLGGPAMTAAATVRDVTMRFRDNTALERVSTTFEKDTITGLLGRNGAGKTTLMQLLTGHRVPTEGRIEVLGASPHENDAILQDICFIKEGQRYPDHFRIKDALTAAALLFPHWDGDLAADLLSDFDLPAGRPIKRLSRGMTSAVGIVIGLASRAPVTLFDEPYLGLDAVAPQLFYDRLLADYAENPRTIVLSTHLIEEIAGLLERVVLLDHGRVLLDADAECLRGSALTVTGPQDEVAAFAGRHELLHTESLGGHSRAVVRLRDRDGGPPAGLTAEPTTLQQLVVALSLHTAQSGSPRAADRLEEVPR